MTHVEWQEIKEIFYSAIGRPVADRAEFLDSACGGDRNLRSEIEVLLASYESGFLEKPLLSESKPKSPGKVLFEEGQIFSHYEIVKLIGRGGMGEVYLANDTSLDRVAAIKIIHDDSGFGDEAPARLLREARAAARLDHPNICSVYEVGHTEGRPFISMEFVAGDTLDRLIADDSVTINDAVSYARQLAAGLAVAHSFGIIHRDIKPSNIIVDPCKRLRILDFGLAKDISVNAEDAKITGAELIVGTVAYMSPEQLRGQSIDEQTDIWGLSVVFFQMLTGHLPFNGETRADLIAAILNKDLAPQDIRRVIPTSIQTILARGLQKKKELRYRSVEEYAGDLADVFEVGQPFSAPVPSASKAPKMFRTSGALSLSRRVGLFTLALIAIAAGIGGLGHWRATGKDSLFLPEDQSQLRISKLYDLKGQTDGAITDMSFSPDGRWLVFGLTGSSPSAVYIIPASGGEPHRISEEEFPSFSPVWSPDAQLIAYIASRHGRKEIWSASYTGSDRRMLLELSSAKHGYQLRKWSNDGKRIFFEGEDGPSEIDLETGNIKLLDLSGIEGEVKRGFSMSPDESRVLTTAYTDGESHLWAKILTGNNAIPIERGFAGSGIPGWFPDNETFAYSADKDGAYQIFIRGLMDTQPQQLTFGNSSSTDPIVSPDGRKIVYLSNLSQANIFETNVDSGKESILTRNVSMQLFPVLAPDGGRIAYQTLSDGERLTAAVLKIDLLRTGTVVPELVVDQSGCCVQWSADGKGLAYIRRTGKDSNIWNFTIAEQRSAQMTAGGLKMPAHSIAPFDFDSSPFALSPDGSALAFVSNRSGYENIWIGKDLAETMLTDFRDDGIRLASPTWSPDGMRLAFVKSDASERRDGLPTRNQIAVCEGHGMNVLAEFSAPTYLLGWATSGEGVYVVVQRDRRLTIDLISNGGERQQTITQLPTSAAFGFRLSPDQKWIAYTGRSDSIDNLFLVSVRGGNSKRLTSNNDPTLFYSGVTWCPDSSCLLYSKQTGGMQISEISTKEDE